MLKSQPLSLLLLAASGVAFASSACADGGEIKTPVKINQTGGAGGTDVTGGTDTGGSVSSGGSTALGGTGGTDVTGGTGGAVVTGGSGGAGVTGGSGGAGVTGGSGGAEVTGGSGGEVTGGSGGAGVTGGSGGAGGAGGSGGPGGAGAGGAGGKGGAGGSAGSDGRIILFDGSATSFSGWTAVRNGGANPWTNNGDGTMTVKSNTGDIISKQTFQNVFIHLEYVTPRIVSAPADNQQRGNSGVYLKGSYEAQILDTYGQQPLIDGCGAIYGVSAPLVVACNQAETWNVYEIEFKAQVCNGSTKTANAQFIEVKLNGTVVQRNVTVNGTTQAGQAETCNPRGLMLQDHSTVVPVSFRNIWMIPRP